MRWADELRVTPFMRWLDNGIQFDYPNIDGTEAGWGPVPHLERVGQAQSGPARGGFEEKALPFGYEDLDLALRMHAHGFRLLYNRAAAAEHLHPTDLDFWRRRVAEVAVAERHFVALHPEYEPYYHELLTGPAPSPALPDLGARLAWLVPPSAPVLGRWVWRSADAVYRRALAQPFMEAWEAAGHAG